MRYSIIGATVDEVTRAGGCNIEQTHRMKIVFADLTPAQANQLKQKGYILEKIATVKMNSLPTPIIGEGIHTIEEIADVIGVPLIRSIAYPPMYGQGCTIAVLDTGIRESHEMVGGRVVYSRNFTISKMEDTYDHGTGVASVIVALAPQCNILNMKVMDDEGIGSSESVVKAIDECIAFQEIDRFDAPQMINLSFGSVDESNPNEIIRIACREAVARGIWVIAAAGNTGPASGSILSPACDRCVWAVGSIDFDTLEVSDYSSRGPTGEGIIKPDSVMYGDNIIVASSRDDKAKKGASGTSLAAPFCSSLSLLYSEGIYSLGIESSSNDGAEGFFDEAEPFVVHVCAKPDGAPTGKDNSYGNGVVMGDRIANTLTASSIKVQNMHSAQSTPQREVSTITALSGTMVSGMVGMRMMGMMTKIIS